MIVSKLHVIEVQCVGLLLECVPIDGSTHVNSPVAHPQQDEADLSGIDT
jgi:hypothetical protein